MKYKDIIGGRLPDKPGKLAQCIPIHGTILGQCIRNRANAGPIFLVCRVLTLGGPYSYKCFIRIPQARFICTYVHTLYKLYVKDATPLIHQQIKICSRRVVGTALLYSTKQTSSRCTQWLLNKRNRPQFASEYQRSPCSRGSSRPPFPVHLELPD